MGTNIQRSRGRGNNYKFDRGGTPTEFGPFIGVVKNNVDPTRSGRLQVYIEQFGGENPDDKTLWRTVSYITPFYGVTPRNNATSSAGDGTYKGNQHSYGMWFTPPDIGVQVICFFVAGDPNLGYYIGCVPDDGVTHMIPAIGAVTNFKDQNAEQTATTQASGAKQLPVVEINSENPALYEDPRFFAQPKPVHSWVYATLFNQGLLADPIRGPITSSSQRESPSQVYGFSTPGRAIYQGGLSDKDIKTKLDSGTVKLSDIKVEGRKGGHSLVMDDGDLRGRDNLIRIRTAKGHQITMSDEADCFYIVTANGQTWIELGSEGTVDVFSTNSVNVRTKGDINLQADKNININAGENVNIKANNMQVESQGIMSFSSAKDLIIASKTSVGLLSGGAMSLDSSSGGWKTKVNLAFKALRIDLNGGPSPASVASPPAITTFNLPDVVFVPKKGWMVQENKLETIVTRAPTHEPYPYHNKGVPVQVTVVGEGQQSFSPDVTKALASTADIPVEIPGLPTPPATDADAIENAATLAGGGNTAVSKGAPNGVAIGINVAQVLKTPIADYSIGSLNKSAVTGLLAQAKSAVGQKSNTISFDKGIGQYGFQPAQLESAGFLKPGTLSLIKSATSGVPTSIDIAEAAKLGGLLTSQQVALARKATSILSSPTVWSGQGGVTSLGTLLGNESLQNTTQQTLLKSGLDGLKTAGLVSGTENPLQLGGLMQSATKYGVSAVNDFVKGIAPAQLAGAISSTISGAIFSGGFIGGKMGGFSGFPRTSTPSSNTVNRFAVDSELLTVLGDNKITAPKYGPEIRVADPPSPLAQQQEQFDSLANQALSFLGKIRDDLIVASTKLDRISLQTPPKLSELTVVATSLNTLERQFSGSYQGYVSAVTSAAARATDPDLVLYETSQIDSINRLVRLIINLITSLKTTVATLESTAK